MTTLKRIVSIDARAVARILAWTYGILATLGSITLLFADLGQITYPFGFVVPGFHLNLNLHLPLTENPLGRLLTLAGFVVSYTITGWISGFLLAALFNLIARRRGGIPTAIVQMEEVASASSLSASSVDHTELSS
jgi:hypothetical protein